MPPGRRARRIWIGARALDGVFLVLFAAGAAKAIDVPRFEGALQTWAFIPARFTPTLALVTPLCEIGVSVLWFFGLTRVFAVIGAMFLIVSFTLVFGLHLAFAQPPDCGCFGPLRLFHDGVAEAKWVVVRNVVLLIAAAGGLALWRGPATGPLGSRPSDSEPSAQRSFTLLEVLLSVVVIGLLIALVAPSLHSMRAESRSAHSLANLRSHAQIMTVYTGDWAGVFPAFTDPDATSTVVRVESRGLQVELGYFFGFSWWNYALADGYYDGDPFSSVFYPPGYAEAVSDQPVGWTPYFYGCCFIADPRYWNAETRTGPEQWGVTRAEQVLYPSDKVLIIASYPLQAEFHEKGVNDMWPDLRAEFACVDGSAARRGLGSMSPGILSGEGPVWPQGFHTSWAFPTLHTVDGVRGRDKR